MSGLTLTNTELIYAMPAAGASLASTTATIITANSSTNPAAYLPPIYSIWPGQNPVGKGFRVVVRGIFDQAAANAVTFKYGLNTAQGTAAPAIVLASTGSAAWASTTTGEWEAEIDIVITSAGESAGVPSVGVYVGGVITEGAANNATTTGASAFMLGGTSSAGAATTISLNPTTAYYWEAAATWGTAPTAMVCTQHLIMGLN